MHPEQPWSDETLNEQLYIVRNYIKRGRYDHDFIKKNFLEAIYHVPCNVDLLIESANYLSTREEFNDAEALYRRVLEINPVHEYAIR